jgi:hypothetical protein
MSKVTDAAAEIADVMAKTMNSVEERKEGADVAAIATELSGQGANVRYDPRLTGRAIHRNRASFGTKAEGVRGNGNR